MIGPCGGPPPDDDDEEIPLHNGEANQVKRNLERITHCYYRIIVAIVTLACAVGLILITTLLVGMVRLSDYARTNRQLNQQNQQLLRNEQQSSEFGILAVRCVLDQFALHRITNQVVHDHVAAALHVNATPLSPLPPMPSDAQVNEDCGPFYRR